MNFDRKYFVVLGLGLVFAGCSGEALKKDNVGFGPGGKVVSEQEFKADVREAKNIYSEVRAVKSDFNSAFNLFSLMQGATSPAALGSVMAFSATAGQMEDHSNFIPRAGTVTDCTVGFGLIDSLYQGAEQNYNKLASLIATPSQGAGDGVVLRKQKKADQSVAYTFEPKSGSSDTKASGSLEGRSNGERVEIVSESDVEITSGGADALVLSQEQKSNVLANINSKRISIDFEAKNSLRGSGVDQALDLNAQITVEAGDSPRVVQDLIYTLNGTSDVELNAQIEAQRVSPDVVVVEGAINKNGEKEVIDFRITRLQNGSCVIK